MFLCAAAVSVLPETAAGQEPVPQPGLIVLSQNICPYENVPKLRAMLDSLFAPVLDELVEDGRLLGWALLSNWWGDDWNWNISYTAESHDAFLTFWNAYVNQLSARSPGWNEEVVALCSEHKDMFYTVVRASKNRSTIRSRESGVDSTINRSSGFGSSALLKITEAADRGAVESPPD